MADERQFAVEVDGAYLELDAAEPRVELGFEALHHRSEVAHPD